MFLGSSELQPWAVNHLNSTDVNDNLLLSMFSISNIYSFTIYICFIEENGKTLVEMTTKA